MNKEEKYSIALVLRERIIFVYIKWEQPRGLSSERQFDTSQYITNFHIGADSDTKLKAKTDLTITNVLLYNRPFAEDEIKELKPKQEEVNVRRKKLKIKTLTNKIPIKVQPKLTSPQPPKMMEHKNTFFHIF